VVFFVYLLDFVKSHRKTKNTTLSEQLQNLIDKQRIHTVRTVTKSNRKTKNTTLSEQLQNLIDKQRIPHCHCSDSVVFFVFLLDFVTVLTVWYSLFIF
jgi:acetolactate synthase regulatory subunit